MVVTLSIVVLSIGQPPQPPTVILPTPTEPTQYEYKFVFFKGLELYSIYAEDEKEWKKTWDVKTKKLLKKGWRLHRIQRSHVDTKQFRYNGWVVVFERELRKKEKRK